MQDLLARLAVRRTFAQAQSLPPVRDFQDPPQHSRRLRGAVIATIVCGLATLGTNGVLLSAAATSTHQSVSSLVQDDAQPDSSHAAPQDLSLDAQQRALLSEAGGQQDDSAGLFGNRGTSPNRNSVRAELNRTLANAKALQRAASLQEVDKSVSGALAEAEAVKRQKQMDADIAKVRAEAARITQEKRQALDMLNKLYAGNNASGYALTMEDLEAITKGGGAMPLRPGTYSLSAYFGKTGIWARYHTGQDFAARVGTPVYAASSGIVAQSRAGGWAGTHVVLNHGNGGSTLYAHLSGKVVSPGQPVRAGQLIGYVGNTGNSYGAHLHFEYYPAGTLPGDVYSAADPMAWLRSLGVA